MKIDNIIEYLEKCDSAYYDTSDPLVSDSMYDALVETLRRVNPNHPYLRKVGTKVVSDKVGRIIPMGTLSKYHKDEEITKWLNSEGGEILLSPKYDGFAVELVYDKGRLISASTRGDGNLGEDVLPAAMKIRSIPIQLSKYKEDITIIRGEAIIPTRNHDKIKELGYTAMRNAVPGIVRSNRTDALMYVDFVAYEFIDGDFDRISQRDYYKEEFLTEDYRLFSSDDIEGMSKRREELRASTYIYELDGVVLKTRDIKEDDLLNPSHMVAWKYKSNRETTTLRGIEYSLGVTGYFNPIGIFDTVEFQGAKLTRASLGNITRMKNEFEGLTIGSIIEVSRRGDIIPYIESLALVDSAGEKIEDLSVCPHCGEPLELDELEPHCVNKKCPEKLRLQISQFVKSVGIKGIGDKLIRGLIDNGSLLTIRGIYDVTSDDILALPRQGQSSVDKWESLKDKKLSSAELLTAYPFIDLGRKVWDTVLTKFNYRQILAITDYDLSTSNLKGIGDNKIKSIVSQIEENYEELVWLGTYHEVL